MGLCSWCSARENDFECCWEMRIPLQNSSFASLLCLSLFILYVVTQEMSNREWRQTHDEALLGIDAHFLFIFSSYLSLPYHPLHKSDPEDLVNNSSGGKNLLEAAQTRPEAN